MGNAVNPIMSEKLSAIIRQWDTEPQQNDAPPPPQFTTQPSLFDTQPSPDQKPSLPATISNIIKKKPGVTALEIRDMVLEMDSSTYSGSISATLKSMFDRKMVVRIPVRSDSNRGSFAYSWVDNPPPRKRKRRSVAKDKGIATLLPKPSAPQPVSPAAPVVPSESLIPVSGITLNIGAYTLSLREAHTLYKQLSELFEIKG
jgi:hypothetical protein